MYAPILWFLVSVDKFTTNSLRDILEFNYYEVLIKMLNKDRSGENAEGVSTVSGNKSISKNAST